MRITKAAGTGAAVALPGDMEQINRLAKTELKSEDIYCFSLRLCDNEIDRDFERFTGGSLKKLSKLFVGRTGVFDHQWTAKGQKSRIYRCELVEEPYTLTAAGDTLKYLKGHAYMLRSEANEELIREIEAGIKKEVSVGCSVSDARCSICGQSMTAKECGHVKGRSYAGKLCYAELIDPTDAFEWSFVAVPAQREAGVIKALEKEEDMTLKELARDIPECGRELGELQAQAETGLRYMERLRAKMVRLAALAEPLISGETIRAVAEKLNEDELYAFVGCYEEKIRGDFPATVQLAGGQGGKAALENEFLI